nr:MAG TPA: hypothetical protein [Caudoviricetes sp.]
MLSRLPSSYVTSLYRYVAKETTEKLKKFIFFHFFC